MFGFSRGFALHLLKNKRCPLAETNQGGATVDFAWHDGQLLTRIIDAPPSTAAPPPKRQHRLPTTPAPAEAEDAANFRDVSPRIAQMVSTYCARVHHLNTPDPAASHQRHEPEGSVDEDIDPAEWTTPPPSPNCPSSAPCPSFGPDVSLYEQRRKFHEANEGLPLPVTKTFRAQVKLTSLLRNANTSVYVHDAIRDWLKDSVVTDGADFKKHPLLSRASFLSDLNLRFDSEGTKPIQKSVLLPSGKEVTLVLHDFSQMLYSLLTDETIMTDENLLFCDNDPYAVPPKQPDFYADVNTGSCYRQAHIKMCTVAGRDVLLPIILFIDKTVTDLHGNLSLEPVSFTLGIFTRQLRNQARAWRPLGYVQNQSLHPSEGGLGVSTDYHFMLKEIFKSFSEVQSTEGVKWDLFYRGKVYHVVFKLPVLFIIGDTEGHDKMVGKFLNRTKLVKRLCRYCNTPNEQSDDPFYKYCYVNQAEVEKYLTTRNLEALQEMSMHPLPNGNAFHALIYADDKRGVHGATPAEILHMILLGLFKYACSQLFGQANQ